MASPRSGPREAVASGPDEEGPTATRAHRDRQQTFQATYMSWSTRGGQVHRSHIITKTEPGLGDQPHRPEADGPMAGEVGAGP